MKHFLSTWGDDSPLKLYCLSRIKHAKHGLSQNESAVLAMMGTPMIEEKTPGVTPGQAADYLGVTPNFIYKHLSTAKKKLNQ